MNLSKFTEGKAKSCDLKLGRVDVRVIQAHSTKGQDCDEEHLYEALKKELLEFLAMVDQQR